MLQQSLPCVYTGYVTHGKAVQLRKILEHSSLKHCKNTTVNYVNYAVNYSGEDSLLAEVS